MDEDQRNWEEYKLHMDLYKHYVDITLRFNLFYYVVTGAVLSFYFTYPSLPRVSYSLIFPFAMTAFYLYLCCMAVGKVRENIKVVERLQVRQHLAAYDIRMLMHIIFATLMLLCVVEAGIIWLWCCHGGRT